MVQYLGVDYVQMELERRKHFLNDRILTIPEHLNDIDGYAPISRVVDDQYRQPWKRACLKTSTVPSELSQINQDVDILCDRQTVIFVELYGCEFDAEHLSANFDLCYDFASSSFNSPALLDLSSENMKVNCTLDMDIFTKFDLSYAIKDNYFYLEKIDCDDTLAEHLNKLPNLKALSDHLHPKLVKDPLCGFLDKLKTLEPLSYDQDYNNDERKEEGFFSPQDITNIIEKEQQGNTECYLSPVIEMEKINTDIVQIDLKRQITLTETEWEKRLENSKVMNTVLNVLECRNAKYTWELEKMNIEDTPTSLKPFSSEIGKFDVKSTINSREFFEGESYNGNITTQEMKNFLYLENPVINNMICSPASFYLSVNMEMYDVDKSEKSDQFITEEEEKRIKCLIWEQEKFMCDMLMLRLTEPDIRNIYFTEVEWISPSNILNMLQLKHCDSGTTELDLNWDPFSNINMKSIKRLQGLDLQISLGGVKEMSSRNTQIADQFEKFSDLELHGCQNSPIYDKRLCSAAKTRNYFERKNSTEEKKSTDSSLPKHYAFGCDPVSDFQMMRSSFSFKIPQQKDILHEQNEKTKSDIQSSLQQNIIDGNHTVPVFERLKKNSQTEVIYFDLNGEYLHLLDIFKETADQFLSILRSNGEFSLQSVSDLTPEMTRFFVKQKQKINADNAKEEAGTGKSTDIYKSVVILHAVCCARDALIHGCLESAITTLRIMQEKYGEILGECLTDLRQKLLEHRLLLQKTGFHHPKIFWLLCHLEKATKNKDFPLDPQSEIKVLIILRREMPGLKEHLMETLNTISSFHVHYQEICGCDHIIKSLENFDCIILLRSAIGIDFPWSQFSYIVEYEREDDQLSELCSRQFIRHVSFAVNKDAFSGQQNVEVANKERFPLHCEKGKLESLTVVGSARVTENTQMLHLLETRWVKHNLIIIDRDYSCFVKDIPFADIDIDENSCILLRPLEEFSQVCVLETVVRNIVKMSLKYRKCWILLHSVQGDKSYPFSGNTVESIQKLCSSLDSFSTFHAQFTTKVMICTSLEEVTLMIRKICESVLTESMFGRQRSFLTNTVSPNELLLIQFPCISPICAMLMLNNLTHKELFTMDASELSKVLPTVTRTTFETFVSILRMSDGTMSSLLNHNLAEKEGHLKLCNAKQKHEFYPASPLNKYLSCSNTENLEYHLPELRCDYMHNQKDQTDSSVSDEGRHIQTGIDGSQTSYSKESHHDNLDFICEDVNSDQNEGEDVSKNISIDDNKNPSNTHIEEQGSNNLSQEIKEISFMNFIDGAKERSAEKVPSNIEGFEMSMHRDIDGAKERSAEKVPSNIEGFEMSMHRDIYLEDEMMPLITRMNSSVLSRDISFKSAKYDLFETNENKDFRSNLEETTRNILRQATYNNRILTKSPRNPNQRISIGFAQPLRRKTENITTKRQPMIRNIHYSNKKRLQDENLGERIQEDVTIPQMSPITSQYFNYMDENREISNAESNLIFNQQCSSQQQNNDAGENYDMNQSRKSSKYPLPTAENNHTNLCYRQNSESPCSTTLPLKGNVSLWYSYDSPPMDLDFNTERANYGSSSNENSLKRREDMHMINTKKFCSTPKLSMKQLKYVKDPQSKGGQTKLAFLR